MYVDYEHNTALVVAAQGGDLCARDRLVAGWLPLVYNIVGRALDGHADVDDVVQETMLCAVSGLGGLRDPERFRSWLVAIAINQVRRRYARRTTTTALDEIAEYPDPAGDFADLTILRLGLSGQRRDVAEATRWLDPDTRELLALWWLEAAGTLTRAELAAALDLPATHVAVRVQRMKEQLEAARVVVRALAADPRCAEVAALITPWDGRPTPLWRKRISRHARACGTCGAHRHGLAPVEGLLAGLALLPPTAVLLRLIAQAPWAAATGAAGPGAVAFTQPLGDPGATADPGLLADPSPLADPGPFAGPNPAVTADPAAGSAQVGPTAPGHAAPRPARRPRRVAAGVAAAIGFVVLAVVLLVDRPHHAGPRQGAPDPAPSPPAVDAARLPSTTPSTDPPPTTGPAGTPPASTEPPATRTTAAVDTRARLERAVVDLVNAARAEHGCTPVRVDERLRTVARKHSDDMLARRFYDHVNPDGVRADGRITAAGYRWRSWGENLDRGRQDASHVVGQWLGSPIHRDNILDCGFTDIGVGVTVGPGGNTWWTQVFATPA
ncbi:sigma-70 family RNA polymerase sigma factor [Embleya sp. NBC_00888]|uniref:sigma-70 family RNA polymerase sigma factor n=1 Tax=Embleya sp. NBC_00888 TaxID=2975960 RepID=UPI00386382D7|nr:sigma-70 family RNA polymerase sigma factor [Embleya sp. NBC_00888]